MYSILVNNYQIKIGSTKSRNCVEEVRDGRKAPLVKLSNNRPQQNFIKFVRRILQDPKSANKYKTKLKASLDTAQVLSIPIRRGVEVVRGAPSVGDY